MVDECVCVCVHVDVNKELANNVNGEHTAQSHQCGMCDAMRQKFTHINTQMVLFEQKLHNTYSFWLDQHYFLSAVSDHLPTPPFLSLTFAHCWYDMILAFCSPMKKRTTMHLLTIAIGWNRIYWNLLDFFSSLATILLIIYSYILLHCNIGWPKMMMVWTCLQCGTLHIHPLLLFLSSLSLFSSISF